MTNAKKLANRLKQTWSKTNSGNWDSLECVLKSAKKMIDNGCIDEDLIKSYIEIQETFKLDFRGRTERGAK